VDLTDVKAIDAGPSFGLALKRDGTVWGWGGNHSGQLGDGTTGSLYRPVQAQGLSEVVAIAAGGTHAIALKADGTVWTWGNNVYGQIGNGESGLSTVDSSDKRVLTPWKVASLSGIVAISAGARHNLAIKSDGTVWTWGGNDNNLIDADSHVVPTPVQRAGLADVRAVTSGFWHALGIKNDGSVWGWGSRYYRQIGDGNPDNTDPNSVVPLPTVGLSNVSALAAGEDTSFALTTDGTVYGWGDNNLGKLGLGSITTNVTVPTSVGVF
jgi:alpha-tubulin suppressor-like RCC1 family protein